jgi:hypothetical protein
VNGYHGYGFVSRSYNEQVEPLLHQGWAIDFGKGICFGIPIRADFGNHKSMVQTFCRQSPGAQNSHNTKYVSDAAVTVLGQHVACWALK